MKIDFWMTEGQGLVIGFWIFVVVCVAWGALDVYERWFRKR